MERSIVLRYVVECVKKRNVYLMTNFDIETFPLTFKIQASDFPTTELKSTLQTSKIRINKFKVDPFLGSEFHFMLYGKLSSATTLQGIFRLNFDTFSLEFQLFVWKHSKNKTNEKLLFTEDPEKLKNRTENDFFKWNSIRYWAKLSLLLNCWRMWKLDENEWKYPENCLRVKNESQPIRCCESFEREIWEQAVFLKEFSFLHSTAFSGFFKFERKFDCNQK